jgi:transcriptional regulator with XRE-family HTH domain
MIILKEKIIEKMKEKNLSIGALERKAGLTTHSIRNILKGRIKNPRAETLLAIAESLEYSFLDLINASFSCSNSLQENTITNKKSNCVEHPTFMAACAKVVASLLEEKVLNLSLDDYFDMIKAVYFYSLFKELRTPDIKFAKWLLEEKGISHP